MQARYSKHKIHFCLPIDYSIDGISEKLCERANLGCCAGTGIFSGAKIKFLKKTLGAALPSSELTL